jgi:hypothetical protein
MEVIYEGTLTLRLLILRTTGARLQGFLEFPPKREAVRSAPVVQRACAFAQRPVALRRREIKDK